VTLTPQDLVEMYRLMLLGRRFTEHILKWYDEGRLPQGLHPSIGQEAVGVGACYGLRAGDWVLPSLRTSEAFFTRGVTMLQQLNAMLGNAASISRGKETSHHAGYPQNGILAGTGIVGGSIPVAVGAALGLRMRGADNVVLCFFGDGAANRGDFHEALNLAAVLKAPGRFHLREQPVRSKSAGRGRLCHPGHCRARRRLRHARRHRRRPGCNRHARGHPGGSAAGARRRRPHPD
jgi:TPP-dependent pyruvate/acetoin dehydrogenase alpha subunit